MLATVHYQIILHSIRLIASATNLLLILTKHFIPQSRNRLGMDILEDLESCGTKSPVNGSVVHVFNWENRDRNMILEDEFQGWVFTSLRFFLLFFLPARFLESSCANSARKCC